MSMSVNVNVNTFSKILIYCIFGMLDEIVKFIPCNFSPLVSCAFNYITVCIQLCSLKIAEIVPVWNRPVKLNIASPIAIVVSFV